MTHKNPTPIRDHGHRWRYYGDGCVACQCGQEPSQLPTGCPIYRTAAERQALVTS